jgi:zinc transport system substrate-binding protein
VNLPQSLIHSMAFLFVITVAAGCGDQPSDARTTAPSATAVTVVVSILPQQWLVEQIGGPHVEVTSLARPGDSPATYQPADAQVSEALRADLYFRIGVPFERGGWANALASSETLRIVDVRRDVPLRAIEAHTHEHHDHDHAHDHTHDDPHIWLAPELLQIQARTVAQALSEVDPNRSADYEANLDETLARLEATDAAIRERLAAHEGKAFFVFHPAWGYFADAYGLQQIAIEVQGKQPSDRELTKLQQLAREHEAGVIFVQPQIAGAGVQSIAAATGATVETIDPLAIDVLDNLKHVAERLARSFEE